MDRAEKAEAVSSLNATLSNAAAVVIVRNLGLTVAQSTVLRNKMRDAGATYKVSKNKLAKIALDGTDYLSLGDLLTGPVGLATSIDPVAAAKVARAGINSGRISSGMACHPVLGSTYL